MYQYRLLYCYIRIIVILNHIQGGFSRGAHLFPFRTQKLSPLAPMVLLTRESRSPPVFIKSSSTLLMSFFCFCIFVRCQMLVLQQGQQWKSFFLISILVIIKLFIERNVKIFLLYFYSFLCVLVLKLYKKYGNYFQ